jgi:hypothetical protein
VRMIGNDDTGEAGPCRTMPANASTTLMIGPLSGCSPGG